ncbi:MAG: hypothetical protein K6T26_05235, partial [Alicyclobacillus sp.]|nr:hypothetical protein [Alicyclobacillus sp.]
MKQKQQRTLGKRVAYPWLGMGGLTLMGWFIGRVALAHTALAAPAPTVSSATPAALAQTADVVVQAFQATGAHATGYRVHGWAVVSRPSVQLAQLVAELEQENGVVSANISERMFTGEDGGQGCAASGLRSDGSRVWAIAAQTPGDAASQPGFSSSERPGASRQVTVAVEVDGPLTDADLPHPLAFQQAWGQLAASLATVADSPQIDGCIQGKRDARMSGGSEEG